VLKVKRVPVPLGTLAISIILSIQVNRIMEFESPSKIEGLIYKLGGVDLHRGGGGVLVGGSRDDDDGCGGSQRFNMNERMISPLGKVRAWIAPAQITHINRMTVEK
jgi:hypothetical protein